MKQNKYNLLTSVILIILFVLTVFFPPPLTVKEAELSVFSKSIFQISSENKASFWQWGAERGYELFFVPILITKVLFTFFPLSIISLRIFGLFLSIITAYIFSLIVNKIIKLSNLIVFILFLLSPWRNYLYTFHLPGAISVSFAISGIYLFQKNKHFQGKISLFLSAFSSWPGLIVISFLCLLKIKLINKQTFILLVIGLSIIYINKSFVINNINNSNLNIIRPSILADEINETQKINFLSVEKRFLLPSIVRKIIYNKPVLALNKSVAHAISIVDFEQFAYPLESYEITRLSGIPPKGNMPLIIVWEIFLIGIGSYYLLKHKNNKLFVPLFIAAFMPYMFFEKKFLSTSGIFLFPLFIFLEIFTLNIIIKKKYYLLAGILLILFVQGYASFYNLFYFKTNQYQSSHPTYYKEISKNIKINKDNYDKIIITTRMGPTPLMSAFYLKSDSKNFWGKYLNQNQDIQIDNLVFKPFQLKTELPEKNVLYIGLIGEFVGTGAKLEERNKPENFNLINSIIGDAVVTDHGNQIWIGNFDI